MNRIAPLTIALLLTACNAQPDAANTTTSSLGNDTSPEGPSLTAQLFGGGKPLPLAIQQQAADGMIFYANSIQAKDTETVLGVKVVNGADNDIVLNWGNQKTFLVADGQKFYLSPPLENKDMKVTAKTTMQGEMVFLGRLPTTGNVTLVLNDGMSSGEYSREPNLSIPIQISTAAYSDDGSKKNSAG